MTEIINISTLPLQFSARSLSMPPEVTVKRSIKVKAKTKTKEASSSSGADAFNWPISFHERDCLHMTSAIVLGQI